MTKKVILLLLAVIMCSGCSYVKKKDTSSRSIAEDSQVNMDIRDTAIEISSGIGELDDITGEKVTAMGIVSGVETNQGSCPVFRLVASEGDSSIEYLIRCQISVDDFNDLNLKDGSSVKIFGTGEETDEGQIYVINATLIDKEM